jgi:hypothetical protein
MTPIKKGKNNEKKAGDKPALFMVAYPHKMLIT